jgi:hypothetical protein
VFPLDCDVEDWMMIVSRGVLASCAKAPIVFVSIENIAPGIKALAGHL